MRCPPLARSAAGRTRQEPSMRRWVCTVTPASVLVSRCFPREMVSVTRCPVRSAVANRGTRKSVRDSTRPASAPCSRRAVSHTASPSGTPGSQDLAEAEQVPDAGLDLEAAGQPGTADAAGVGGDGDQVVALGGEPDLGGVLGPVRLPDR